MDTHLNTKRILIFLAFAFAIPWTAVLVLYLTVGVYDMDKAISLARTYLNYFFVLPAPAIAMAATRLITKEGWGHLMLRPDFRRGWRFYLAGWLLPFLAIIMGTALFYFIFPRSFDPNFGGAREMAAGSPLAAADPWTLLLTLTLLPMITSVPVLTLISLGEELGWRGYLLPKLMERFAGTSGDDPAHSGSLDAAAARKAALLIGVIWGVWHWPGLFLAMRSDPEMPILYPVVYTVFTCLLSVLLTWITLCSGSVWPAAIGHGTHNLSVALPGYLLKGPVNLLLGPAPGSLIGGMGYLALALVLWFSHRAFARKEEAGSDSVRAVAGALKA